MALFRLRPSAARVAGLMAFMASVDVFDVEEVAGKVLPNISGSMIDKEK